MVVDPRWNTGEGVTGDGRRRGPTVVVDDPSDIGEGLVGVGGRVPKEWTPDLYLAPVPFVGMRTTSEVDFVLEGKLSLAPTTWGRRVRPDPGRDRLQ